MSKTASSASRTDPAPRPAIVRTFMTHTMSDSDIEALSTGRETEFQRIMAAIDRSRHAAPNPPQHVVLYGARGFGKSFMARRVELEIPRLAPEPGPIHYLLFPEEQHNLGDSPHALLDMVTHAVEAIGTGGNQLFERGMPEWPNPGAAERRWRASVTALDAAIAAKLPAGTGLIIIAVENFDHIIGTLFKDEETEQWLRAWLSRPAGRVMLLATATGAVDVDYDRPLFHAFQEISLGPWRSEDCIQYFDARRRLAGLDVLDPQQQAKARAVADFIGGTPRLAQLLYEVIDTDDALTVAQTMDGLADRLADYYHKRLEDLAPRPLLLLDAIIRGGEPVSQTALAARVKADGQSDIARPMADLQRTDLIRGERATDGREMLYRATDRVMVHYYRLRQGSTVARETPLETILDFLERFYTKDELRRQALHHFDKGRLGEASVFSRLAAAADGGWAFLMHAFKRRLRLYPAASLAKLGGDADQLPAWLAHNPLELVRRCQPDSGTADAVTQAVALAVRCFGWIRLREFDRAQQALRLAWPAQVNAPAAVIILLDILMLINPWHRSTEYSLVEVAKVVELVKQMGQNIDDSRLRFLALEAEAAALRHLGRYEQALATSQEHEKIAINAGDTLEQAVAIRGAVFLLYQLERYEEALTTAHAAAACAKTANDHYLHTEAVCIAVLSLSQLGQYLDALALADENLNMTNDAGAYGLFAELALCAAGWAGWLDAVPVYRAWLVKWQAEVDRDRLEDPMAALSHLFVAVARTAQWDQLDALLHQQRDSIASEDRVEFYLDHGAALAAIGADAGRAAGYGAMAELLPRVAAFLSTAPADNRDDTWLDGLMIGYAAACRDPGLLRDVAGLLTAALDPTGPKNALLLSTLADFDEAANPNAHLARLDPDRALLVRRLRNIPDPEPAPPKKARKRRRR